MEATMSVESWTGEGDIATTQAEIAVIIKEVIKYFMVFKFKLMVKGGGIEPRQGIHAPRMLIVEIDL